MALLAYLTLALLCISAQAAPASNKALADDVSLATTESQGLDIESLEFANALNLLDLKTDLQVRPVGDDIIQQLKDLNINEQEVKRIQSLFSDGFDIIQEGVRRVERPLRQMGETLGQIINDLTNSNWGNLGQQELRLTNEVAEVNSQYARAQVDLNETTADLERNLVQALDGQDTTDIVAVLSNYQKITDFFDAEFLTLADVHVIFDVRAQRTLTAIDVVLDQV